MLLARDNTDFLAKVQSGIERAVAFNASLSPGLCPTKIARLNPPVGARSWEYTDEGRRLYALEQAARSPDYHGGVPFPLPEELEVAAIVKLCSGYLSLHERFKLAAGTKRRKMTDHLARGTMRIQVWGESAYSARTHLTLDDLPWLHVKLSGLPLSFSGAEIVHTESGTSLARVIGENPLFRKLSELARHGEEASLVNAA